MTVKLQESIPVQNSLLRHRTDQGQVTLTADLAHPRRDIGILLHGLANGDAAAALARTDTTSRLKPQTARIERICFNDTAELGFNVPRTYNTAASAQGQIGADHVADERTWVDAGHLPEHAKARHPEKKPVAPPDPSRV